MEGRALCKGDELPLNNSKKSGLKVVPEKLRIKPYSLLSVRVIEGPEASLVSEKELEKLYTDEFEISTEYNRMGLRLKGTEIKFPTSFEMLSSGIVRGTIQLPPNGQPMVLLADAQTTGGYPRIATVINADLSLLAQQKPGDKIRFRRVSIEEAHSLAYNKKKVFKKELGFD